MSRIGTRPASGTLEEASETATPLQQEPSQRKDCVVQTDQFEIGAHAPIVPRHPGHIEEDRPGTAASTHSVSRDWFQSPARPKRGSRRPPVSFKKPNPLAPRTPAQLEDIASEPGSLVGMRGRNGSSSSLRSTRFKDLLDAQEEIRPTAFRSRVEATGVREYDEDVADRNIARNITRESLAIPSTLPVGNRTKSHSLTNTSAHLKPTYIKGHTSGLQLREPSSLREVEEVSPESRRDKRRLSLNTYVPSGMAPSLNAHYVKEVYGMPGGTTLRESALTSGKLARNGDSLIHPKSINDALDVAEGKTQSQLPQSHATFKSSEDESAPRMSMSVGLQGLSSDLGEQPHSRPSSQHDLSDSTAESNVKSGSSGGPRSRHTASTSLDSTRPALSIRKSEGSSLSASNFRPGTSSGWSPTTTRSTEFNIDDHISSDDESIITPRKHSRVTAEGEEGLLFKEGYGVAGVALPGLEALEGDAVYFARYSKESRRISVSSDGSAAIAAGPVDNRLDMAREIPTPSMQGSVPDGVLYSSTFGRSSMPDHLMYLAVSTIQGDDGDISPAEEFYEVPKLLPGTTTAGNENGEYHGMDALEQGATCLSALGTPQYRIVGSDATPTTSATRTMKQESGDVGIGTAVRLRKDEKARKRAEELRSTREKRLTRALGKIEDDKATAKLEAQVGDAEEGPDRGGKRDVVGGDTRPLPSEQDVKVTQS
ncbi:hypothetical protein VPNG_01745 [Cytospora leucostoma]|uniref:Uncharacterized protein n=1 Tax=Cytospora leucostoma TaxID=1230097 RepID=A0A423XJT8_9PEZI|nr:hypothetical protein VPNG_01745 [Cytospora leucostoma]